MFFGKRMSGTGALQVAGPSDNTILAIVTVNNGASGATVSLYDGTSTSGTLMAVIDAATSGTSFGYFIRFANGIHAVMANNNADVTFSHT